MHGDFNESMEQLPPCRMNWRRHSTCLRWVGGVYGVEKHISFISLGFDALFRGKHFGLIFSVSSAVGAENRQ